LLARLLEEGYSESDGFWRLVPHRSLPSERISTWTTRDMVEALDSLYVPSPRKTIRYMDTVQKRIGHRAPARSAARGKRVQAARPLRGGRAAAAKRKVAEQAPTPLVIIHLSDIQGLAAWRAEDRGGDAADRDRTGAYDTLLDSLRSDIEQHERESPPVPRPNAVLISGDLINKGQIEHYAVVAKFLAELAAALGIDRDRVVMIPGNHEVNWELSAWAYGTNPYGPHVEEGAEDGPRNDIKYPYRLLPFKMFFDEFYGGRLTFALSGDPFVVFDKFVEEHKVVLVGFNSVVQTDHTRNRRDLGYIPFDAPRKAARSEALKAQGPTCLRVATWHHDLLTGMPPEPGITKYYDEQVRKQLLGSGFRILMHGHSHAAEVYETDLINLGAGSIGAAEEDKPAGARHFYQIVEIDVAAKRCRVHARQWSDLEWQAAPVLKGRRSYRDFGLQVR